ncbi:MAG TPA: hypothetical protein VF169_00355 [Albitalea sp.]|uniref:hypothetical protein n=1 Tax=Piscinibacter sp. TaxID=1903157 RepID=UPI002ED1E352
MVGPVASPRLVHRGELLMWAKDDPLTIQPHHAVMALPWAQAVVDVQPSVRAIERLAVDALRRLLHELEAVCGSIGVIAVVGSMGRDPGLIANPHIRAHAAEGQLYRQVLETAAGTCGVAAMSFSPRTLADAAALRLGMSAQALAAQVQALGKGKVHPWRVDERQATCAAWAALHP